MERRGKIRSANPTIRLNSCLQKNYFRISTDNMSNAVTVKITGLRQNCQIIGAKNRHKFDVCSLHRRHIENCNLYYAVRTTSHRQDGVLPMLVERAS